MTPVTLNPPGPSLQGQNQLFISPSNQDRRTLFNILDRKQTIEFGELRENYHHQGDKLVLQDGSSSNHQLCNSSFKSPEPVMHDPSSARDPNLFLSKMEGEDSKNNGHGSAKWMPSKMRLIKKMMRPSTSSPATDKVINTGSTPSPRFQNQGHENRYSQRSPRNNSSNTTRVCSDCNTSSTPLWRSGPMGPKSLCNACGIRQRKARRAMAEAANGSATPMNAAASTKTRVHNKEKKPRTNQFAQSKNKSKSATTTAAGGSSQGEKKPESFAIGLRNDPDFQQQEYPCDEVTQAALLLMDLSCGFVYS